MNEPAAQVERVSPNRTPDPVRLLTAEDVLSLDESDKNDRFRLPLQELDIEGLLSFGEKVHFEFGRLNILVGPNGSGKSNLIDCVRMLRFAPLDIQEAFKDSGFGDWLYRGVNQQTGNALLQVLIGVPELPSAIRHQIRLGPPSNSRASIEEIVSRAETEGEHFLPYFVGSYRGGATLSVPTTGKRRRERELSTSEYNPLQSILSQIRDIGLYPEISRLATLECV